jgi:TRAP-type C4-dicarboxylate transport system permease small subunit
MVLTLENTETAIRRGAIVTAKLGVALLLLQAFLIVADGLARWWFSKPIHGLEDVSGLMISIIVASLFPAILIGRQNIRVTIFGRFFSPKAAAWLDVFGHFVLLAFIIIIAWQFALYAVETRAQTTLILRLPTAPTMWLTAAILLACAPIQGFVLLTEIVKITKPQPSRQA